MNMDKNKDSRACDSTSAVACNDRQNADNQKVDSRIFTQTAQSLSLAPTLSLRALKKGEAIHKATAQKVDSSTTANLNEPAKDSKICDEKTSDSGRRSRCFFSKSLLCERVQGRILGVCNCSTREAIKDLSRKTSEAVGDSRCFFSKAESTNKAESPQAQKIPLIDLHAQYHTYKHELDSAIASVLHSQHFILGEHSQALERELASFVGRRFCITCSSGTSALLLALLALDIGAGDEVITPSFSFIAAAEMVAFLGAKPVFVDICPHTYTLDIAQVKRAISPRTRAIIPVSLFGQPYDVAGLESLAKPHAIPIIEDGAQSFGAAITLGNEAKSARSGSFGDLSVTSFFPSKPLGGYGDGGAVFCDDENLATKLYALRNHGQASKYRHTMLGLNARLDELQCAILRVKLRHFASELHLREQVAARYCTLLAPLQKHLALPYIAPNRTSVFAQFCLRVKDSREDWVVDRHLPDLAQHNQSSSQAAQSLSPAPTLSLRALKKGEAIHKDTTQKVDSSVEVDSMDCHTAAHAAARNDDKKVDSSTTANLNESQDKTAQSVFDSQAAGGRIFDEKAGLCSLLCGDKTDGLSHKQKANSPLFRKKPTPTERPSDSKISRLESGLFKPCKEIRLERLSTKRGEEIHDSSPKAESPQQNEDSSTTITRTHIISALNARGIATAIHYPTPLHLQEVFSHLGYKKGDFPISEQIAQEIFSIPFSPYLTEAAQEHIARVLREIFAQI
ncbi:DegT/DnrJ/EryC1/StrS family aminotransferase [Helicobacter zhangjianzhongii]|uniref:DegT/DnrJ/EryC1/StrS family aminotransferase n=1 Tax=Helicobacter zhangjianzhongii TaxID=2974574 RepID=A0ACC6FTK1_9HELI|nr:MULTISPECIES: DegT/DnrJ/EryC1/StrS family aminotransferase [unclassified Helicobacter]MDL0079868.1 DegT/DnrJ/EryC1/StrS family aminotransferase [Helicobacter sp. CPD2-1]MDL0082036.1 DegT/DnrJ/EryC1/StrS family aminotransferase [Helicobacter sp. XJK30-2]